MASRTEDHGAVPARRLADLLHSTQEGDSSHCLRMTEEKGTDLALMAHNLAQMESFCGFIPIKANSKAPKVTYKGKPYLTLKECLSYKPAAIAVRSENIGCLDYDYPRSLDYAASRGIDFTAKGFHVRKTSDNWKWDNTGLDFGRFKTLVVLTDEQAAEIGPCNSAKQDYQGSGIDVFPKAKPYIIVSG